MINKQDFCTGHIIELPNGKMGCPECGLELGDVEPRKVKPREKRLEELVTELVYALREVNAFHTNRTGADDHELIERAMVEVPSIPPEVEDQTNSEP